MSQDWLVAMGIDVRHPHGDGRSLLGHRLVLILRSGPMSMRQLHAATWRRSSGVALRSALGELQAAGLVDVAVRSSGPRGGRPRETWRLLYPESLAVRLADQALAAHRERATARRRRRRRPSRAAPATHLPGIGQAPGGGRPAGRPSSPVPRHTADDVCDWILHGGRLADYCRRPGAPCRRTVYAWVTKDPEFRRRLELARDLGRQMAIEELLAQAEAL